MARHKSAATVSIGWRSGLAFSIAPSAVSIQLSRSFVVATGEGRADHRERQNWMMSDQFLRNVADPLKKRLSTQLACSNFAHELRRLVEIAGLNQVSDGPFRETVDRRPLSSTAMQAGDRVRRGCESVFVS